MVAVGMRNAKTIFKQLSDLTETGYQNSITEILNCILETFCHLVIGILLEIGNLDLEILAYSQGLCYIPLTKFNPNEEASSVILFSKIIRFYCSLTDCFTSKGLQKNKTEKGDWLMKKLLTASSFFMVICATAGIAIGAYVPEPIMRNVMIALSIIFAIGAVILLIAILAKCCTKTKQEKEIGQ